MLLLLLLLEYEGGDAAAAARDVHVVSDGDSKTSPRGYMTAERRGLTDTLRVVDDRRAWACPEAKL